MFDTLAGNRALFYGPKVKFDPDNFGVITIDTL
jgi:hypothetical protein